MKWKGISGLILLTFMTALFAAPTPSTVMPVNFARLLNWVPAPNNPYTICGGYYKDLPIEYTPNPLVSTQVDTYDITGDHVLYSMKGMSEVEGHVQVSQPNQQLNANHLFLDRNSKTNKIEKARAYGDVRIFQLGRELIGQYAIVNMTDNTMYLENGVYRMLVPPKKTEPADTGSTHYGLSYWGHAKTITQPQKQRYVLTQSTYTTCPPTHDPHQSCDWHLHATTVHLNHDKGVGDAWNSVLWVKNIPVFYTPYINFPLNHERKSGFLPPTYGSSAQSGRTFAVPYYWNIAPNYDATLTPTYYSKRGIMYSGLFRYLFHPGKGRFALNFLPDDRQFRRFQNKTTISSYLNNIKQPQPQGLANLKSDSDNRYSLNFNDISNFNSHLTSNIDYSRVSDDYYIKDLGRHLLNDSDNQIYQFGQLQYQSTNWHVNGLMQNYQTLHPINQQSVANQYARLPELNIGTFYSDLDETGLDTGINADDVQFKMTRPPDSTPSFNPASVMGNRLSLQPVVSYPINEPYGYLTPRLQWQLNQYSDLDRKNPVTHTSPSLSIPTFDTHGGLYFNRYFSTGNHPYRQTLEPELYYVYTPYFNQNKLPYFDTVAQSFDYNFLFDANRFSGVDRIGDANQITAAITTRFIDEMTGTQIASASIGEIAYFANRKVTLCTGINKECQPSALSNRTLSPIAGQLTYTISQYWSTSGNLTWDQYAHTFSNEAANLTYSKTGRGLSAGYTLSRDGATIEGLPSNQPSTRLEQLNLGGSWLIKRHVDLLGRWSYSWTGNQADNHGNAYLGGIEYNSCCWAVRFIASRAYAGISNNKKNQYNDAYYVQFDLKGLGSVGNNDPTYLINQSGLTGYQNTFDDSIV